MRSGDAPSGAVLLAVIFVKQVLNRRPPDAIPKGTPFPGTSPQAPMYPATKKSVFCEHPLVAYYRIKLYPIPLIRLIQSQQQ